MLMKTFKRSSLTDMYNNIIAHHIVHLFSFLKAIIIDVLYTVRYYTLYVIVTTTK